MSTNKNAFIRYQALDKCFRDRRYRYYIDDLIEKCEEAMVYYNGDGGVSRRQIFDDIKFMESKTGWSIPLERKKDGRKIYYRYEKPDFSINKQPLTDEEAQQLKTVILTLSHFRGLPSNEWVDEVISNLEFRFNLRGHHEHIIGFEQNPNLKGINNLAPIIEATSNHQVLSVTYRSYKSYGQEKTSIVHPYYVKQYNNRWFLLALDNDMHYITNFALDRILSIEKNENILFESNDSIDFEHYFDDVFGVTIPPTEVEKETIVLKFTENQFPYIKSKPIHVSQKILNVNEGIISIDVKANYELDQHILSFGPDVEVISPDSYRAHIYQKLVNNLKYYESVQIDCTDTD